MLSFRFFEVLSLYTLQSEPLTPHCYWTKSAAAGLADAKKGISDRERISRLGDRWHIEFVPSCSC